MPKAYFNPFYLLSVLIGIAFLVTAFLYGVMAFRGAAPHLLEGAEDQSAVMVYMSKNGSMLLLVELGALMIATIAAIGTDDFWARFAKPAKDDSQSQAAAGVAEDDGASPDASEPAQEAERDTDPKPPNENSGP